MKKLLLDFTKDELSQELALFDLKPYRAEQVYNWICSGADFSEMTNIPKSLRETLSEKFDPVGSEIIKEAVSKDGTVKFLYKLNDGNLVEGVLMSYKYGYTLCASTQVGCRMGCAFCASGKDGLLRNLGAGEILSEVIEANKYLRKKDKNARIGNVVLMGSGEPLDNYDNVTKFLSLVTESQGISQRGISLSTCGLVRNIRRLADDGFSVTLCISLHATSDEKRLRVMPTANAYKIGEIMSAAEYYFKKSGRRVIIEYAMMHGFNISESDAIKLRELTKNFPCHINLIPLNDADSNLVGVNRAEANAFLKKLLSVGASATIRRSLGADIEGACGQLKRRYINGGNNEN